MATIPQFSLPLRLVGTDLLEVEQDTDEEISDCVEMVLRTTLGQRPTLPDFGIADPTFTLGGADLEALRLAVETWEPRASALFEREPDLLTTLTDRITVTPITEG